LALHSEGFPASEGAFDNPSRCSEAWTIDAAMDSGKAFGNRDRVLSIAEAAASRNSSTISTKPYAIAYDASACAIAYRPSARSD
jgi:hypothetical protein